MNARIGDRIQPMAELIVQIIEIAEGPAEEEVLADVAERPFDLALGLGPIGPAGARLETVMAGEIDKRAIVDDEPIRVLADDRLIPERSATRLREADLNVFSKLGK